MTQKKRDDKAKEENPELRDVESGGDADETPVSEPGKTPPSPNQKAGQL